MPFLLTRPLTSSLCAALLVALLLLGFQSFRLSRAEEELKGAKARELQAQIQAKLFGKVQRIEDRRHTIETRIVEVAHEAADDVRSAVGGDAPVAPGVLGAWAAGIKRVRAASGPGPDDTRTGEPAGAVPPP